MLRGCLSIVGGPRWGFDAPVWLHGAVCSGARRREGGYSGGVEHCSQQSEERCYCSGRRARGALVRFCVCVFKVLVMVSTEANLVTSDLVRWSLQVNEYRTMMVHLLLFFKCLF